MHRKIHRYAFKNIDYSFNNCEQVITPQTVFVCPVRRQWLHFLCDCFDFPASRAGLVEVLCVGGRGQVRSAVSLKQNGLIFPYK